MKSPNAPTSAVLEIIKTFRGVDELGNTDGWLVTFEDRGSAQNAQMLISMLQGWDSESEGNIKNMIRILPAV